MPQRRRSSRPARAVTSRRPSRTSTRGWRRASTPSPSSPTRAAPPSCRRSRMRPSRASPSCPWGSDPSGVAGTDYLTYVDWDTTDSGKVWGQWMVDALGGTGNIVYLGGPAGVAVGLQQLDGIKEVLRGQPGHEAPDRRHRICRHQLGPGHRTAGDDVAAQPVPPDRRRHLQLRHGRRRSRPGLPGRRPTARAHRDPRGQRPRVRLRRRQGRQSQVRAGDHLVPQLARPHRCAQGHRGRTRVSPTTSPACTSCPCSRTRSTASRPSATRPWHPTSTSPTSSRPRT